MLLSLPHVVIVGGGFGGLSAAKALDRAPVRLTLVDRRNFHLFQPLLYQVATGGLSPANIAAPLREVLKRQRNVEVLLGEVTGVDAAGRRLQLRDGELPYDTLVVATGARHNYFGHADWAARAPGLKTVEDATAIRRRLLFAFEAAERLAPQEDVRGWLTFVIVGAGPTGVELAGAVAEIARDTLRHNFRRINPADAAILLVEAAERVLPAYPEDLSAKAAASLARLGVAVRTKTTVTDILETEVLLRSGDEQARLPARTVLWAAGVQASRLGHALSRATGCQTDRAGRVIVQPDLTVPNHPEIFVIGDLSQLATQPLPGLAPVAIAQGRYVASAIRLRLRGTAPRRFRYQVRGIMATIGRGDAVADVRGLRLNGLPAWLAWLFVHLLGIVTFQNRLLVTLQWAWNYVTRNRSARLITGEVPGIASEELVTESSSTCYPPRPS